MSRYDYKGGNSLKRIVAVQPLDNYQLLLTFDSNERKIYDMNSWLDKPYFQQLKDLAFFRSVHVNKITHTVEWDGGRDLCPDMLYTDSKDVNKRFHHA